MFWNLTLSPPFSTFCAGCTLDVKLTFYIAYKFRTAHILFHRFINIFPFRFVLFVGITMKAALLNLILILSTVLCIMYIYMYKY